MPPLIVIFVLLGLALLLGGVGAIVDGWPYLVLERGFTQVIIGTVAATAGLVLLALSWILVELRQVRTSLKAMTLLSAATALPTEPTAPAFGAAREPVLPEAIVPAPVVPAAESRLPGFGTVAASAGLAAAGGALASTFSDRGIGARRDPADENGEEPARAEHAEVARDEGEPSRPEPAQADIFDEALVDVAATKVAGDEALANAADAVEDADEPAQASAEGQGALFDEQDEVLSSAVGSAAAEEAPPVRQDDEPSVAREDEPEQAGEPGPAEEPEPAAPEPREEPKRSWWPRFGSRAQEPERARAPEADDLTALRQHLTFGPQPPAKPAEPEAASGDETRGDEDIRTAESWMSPGRREPSFDELVSAEAGKPQEDYVEPGIPAISEPVTGEPEAEAPGEDAAADEGEVPAEQAPAEPQGPAASEEGVVGAYQVGDTHFTMYADGSIRARTPDGEYSFASMDELRAYLASEKSKLGS